MKLAKTLVKNFKVFDQRDPHLILALNIYLHLSDVDWVVTDNATQKKFERLLKKILRDIDLDLDCKVYVVLGTARMKLGGAFIDKAQTKLGAHVIVFNSVFLDAPEKLVRFIIYHEVAHVLQAEGKLLMRLGPLNDEQIADAWAAHKVGAPVSNNLFYLKNLSDKELELLRGYVEKA